MRATKLQKRFKTRLDWFLASSGLLPSTGWEELTAYKPDHTAVSIELAVNFRAPQFQGIKKAPEANLEDAHLRFWIEPAAWQAALNEQDVEELCLDSLERCCCRCPGGEAPRQRSA
eukprot:45594-Amphidinium_carterae.1